jgi:hypothetical protein
LRVESFSSKAGRCSGDIFLATARNTSPQRYSIYRQILIRASSKQFVFFAFMKFIHFNQFHISLYSGFKRLLISLRPKASFQTKQTKYFGIGAGGFRTLIAGSKCLLGSFLLLLIFSLAILTLLRFSYANIGFCSCRQPPGSNHTQPPSTSIKKNFFFFFSFAVRSDGYFSSHLFIISITIGCDVRNCSVVISSRISSSRCDDLPCNSASPPLFQLRQVTAN